MEVSGVVFRPNPSLWVLGSRGGSRITKFSNSGFRDDGHVHYYYGSTPAIWCGSGKKDKVKEKDTTAKKKMKKMVKKRLKLVQGLSRDLSMFSDMGFGLDPHNHGLIDQVKGNMISEATELLLRQLQQLRTEEEELKRKRKEEKVKLKAARMQNRMDCELSSDSSSESSDSECGDVVDMSCLKNEALAQPIVNELQPVMQEATLTLPSTLAQEANTTELQSLTQEAITQSRTGCSVGMGNSYYEGRSVARASAKKVEVCMGGKCKKSGAAALLKEFQRVLGAEDTVVGCKCMGKCRDGPNVRVLNFSDRVQAEGADDSVRTPSNPLCIGVGFEDVGLVVANFFGETKNELGLAAAS